MNGNGASGPSNAAGYPHITVPAGFAGGLPIGMSSMARAWQEPKLLRFSYAFEQATSAGRRPRFVEFRSSVVEGPHRGGVAPLRSADMAATTTAEAPHLDPERGLSSAEVAERVARGQVNDVPAAPTRTVAQIVRANVFTRFNAILGVMLAIILVVGPLQDALFGIVLIANAGIGIVQELRAKRTLDRLTLLTAPKARVVRDGDLHEVAVGDVVLDDVLDVGAGSEIVVDGEVLASRASRSTSRCSPASPTPWRSRLPTRC